MKWFPFAEASGSFHPIVIDSRHPSGAKVQIGGIRFMAPLLAFSRFVDWINQNIGKVCDWLVLLAVLVSSVNAMMRYGFDISSNAWLEAQWYMYAAIVMLGASYTLKRNEHVRVDLLYMMLSRRGQIQLDIAGIIVFMLPACILIGWLSWPFFMQSFHMNEWSSNAGGLLRWPVKFLIPLGFGLLTLQGISELIKRVAALRGYDIPDLEAHYERPVQ
jgi:TRAP-type mannitol/chloroaromatic compound transport system permease small subunit